MICHRCEEDAERLYKTDELVCAECFDVEECGDICCFHHPGCDGYCDHGVLGPHRNSCIDDEWWEGILGEHDYIPSPLELLAEQAE